MPIINRNPPVPNPSTNVEPPLAGEPGPSQARDSNDDDIAQPGPSTQIAQLRNSNIVKFGKRKKPKKSRKVKKQANTTNPNPPPPGFLTVSGCIASKGAKSSRPNILQELLRSR
ncbi:unnamed protein product [Arctia plantaginis]|uniref:Uncharacterized protein n=1 Tax=Arctia plantaginis TaxID=874455 RepID=A0A8S1ATW3_ARCPL|nr:unnamed protein product [Arctia plantaginis]